MPVNPFIAALGDVFEGFSIDRARNRKEAEEREERARLEALRLEERAYRDLMMRVELGAKGGVFLKELEEAPFTGKAKTVDAVRGTERLDQALAGTKTSIHPNLSIGLTPTGAGSLGGSAGVAVPDMGQAGARVLPALSVGLASSKMRTGKPKELLDAEGERAADLARMRPGAFKLPDGDLVYMPGREELRARDAAADEKVAEATVKRTEARELKKREDLIKELVEVGGISPVNARLIVSGGVNYGDLHETVGSKAAAARADAQLRKDTLASLNADVRLAKRAEQTYGVSAEGSTNPAGRDLYKGYVVEAQEALAEFTKNNPPVRSGASMPRAVDLTLTDATDAEVAWALKTGFRPAPGLTAAAEVLLLKQAYSKSLGADSVGGADKVVGADVTPTAPFAPEIGAGSSLRNIGRHLRGVDLGPYGRQTDAPGIRGLPDLPVPRDSVSSVAPVGPPLKFGTGRLSGMPMATALAPLTREPLGSVPDVEMMPVRLGGGAGGVYGSPGVRGLPDLPVPRDPVSSRMPMEFTPEPVAPERLSDRVRDSLFPPTLGAPTAASPRGSEARTLQPVYPVGKTPDWLVDATVAWLVKEEAFRPKAYWDPLGKVWTVGIGETGPGVTKGTTRTKEQALAWTRRRVISDADAMARAGGAQHPALLSLAYNAGVGVLNQTIIPALKVGDYEKAMATFMLYVKSQGSGAKPAPPLVARRQRELQLLLKSYLQAAE